MAARQTPYEMAFAPIAEARFPALREGLANAGVDLRDRDGFVLVKEVVELLRDIGPEDTLGEGVEELVALTHAAFLHWVDGEAVVMIDRETVDTLVARSPQTRAGPAKRTYYLQLPPQRVWGEALEGSPAEPLDGWFVAPTADRLDIVAVFGLHPGRLGYTVARVAGARPALLTRADGGAPFHPLLAGGSAAGLHQVIGEDELIELAWRCHSLVPASGVAPGQQRVRAV